MYEAYKFNKKQFRRTSRQYPEGFIEQDTLKLNNIFQQRRMSCLWNEIKRHRNKKSNSSLNSQDLASYYAGTMQDNNYRDLSQGQLDIKECVENAYKRNTGKQFDVTVSADQVEELIERLHCNIAAGPDESYTEHFKYCNSTELCTHIARLNTTMLQ